MKILNQNTNNWWCCMLRVLVGASKILKWMHCFSVSVDWLPIVRNIVALGVCMMNLSLSISLSLTVIALGWIRYRPLLGFTILALSMTPFILSKLRQTNSSRSRYDWVLVSKTYEPRHEFSNNVVCASSKGSDQPVHTCSLIRAFASCLSILWLVSYWLNSIWSI